MLEYIAEKCKTFPRIIQDIRQGKDENKGIHVLIHYCRSSYSTFTTLIPSIDYLLLNSVISLEIYKKFMQKLM